MSAIGEDVRREHAGLTRQIAELRNQIVGRAVGSAARIPFVACHHIPHEGLDPCGDFRCPFAADTGHLGDILIAPSSRIVSPLSIGFSTIARTSLAYSDGSPRRLGNGTWRPSDSRSEEHTSELQSLMRHSYAVFCLK